LNWKETEGEVGEVVKRSVVTVTNDVIVAVVSSKIVGTVRSGISEKVDAVPKNNVENQSGTIGVSKVQGSV